MMKKPEIITKVDGCCPLCEYVWNQEHNSVGLNDENGNIYFETVPRYHCKHCDIIFNKYQIYS